MNRIDMLDVLAERAFGIAEPDGSYPFGSEAYQWRWLCDELIQAMSDEQAFELLNYIARMHDVDTLDKDADA